jgi:ABC-type glycerol-3-phosphate transport system substrate-binding protein
VTIKIQANEEDESPTVELFKSAHTDINVEYFNVTGIDHEEVASKILSMVAAGQQLDLGYSATEAAQLYAGQGLSQALDDYVLAAEADLAEYFADVHPSLVEAFMYEGSLYQLPFDFNAANMYYNTKLFAEAGFEHPASDWTRDQFLEIAKAITKKDASGQTETFGYAWTNRLWGSWMPWIFVAGGNLLTEERAPGGEWLWEKFYQDDPAAVGRGGGWRWTAPQANHPANVAALEFVAMMTQEGIAPAIELGGGQTLQGFFTGGKLGMTPAGGFWSGGLHNAGMPMGDFDVQLFPKWENQRHQFGTGANFMFAASEFKDVAWEYVKFRISKEAMAAHGVFNPVTRTTPSRRSMANAERYSVTGPAHWEVFYDTLDKHPDTAPIPAPPISNPMTTLFTAYTARAMTFELSPQEALDGMQKELEDLFARQGADMYKTE